MENLKIISNNKNWLESNAIEQFKAVLNLKDVKDGAALPDLHMGMRSPVGIVLEVENRVYPHIIGNDIGCGMTLFKTDLALKQFKIDKWTKKLEGTKLIDVEANNPYKEIPPIRDFGTIGGGNHFAEFQAIDKIFNEELFKKLDINKKDLLMLVHSGSRGYGQEIFEKFLDYDGLTFEDNRFKEYLSCHNNAVLWAERNRIAVCEKLISMLGFDKEIEKIIDCCHNFIEITENKAIHRKGTVSALKGYAVIAGSRGSLSYIVKPNENNPMALYSISHGAGRKWARGLCKGKLENKYDKYSIKETAFKGRVICDNLDLLYEEATEAYKIIENVINTLVENDLIEVVATLKPLLTYKA